MRLRKISLVNVSGVKGISFCLLHKQGFSFHFEGQKYLRYGAKLLADKLVTPMD
jgi:hypothetical protein